MANQLVASGSVTQANMRISAVDGTAFVDFGAADVLTSKLGNLLVIKDSLGHSIQGWIKAAGSSETKAAAKSVTGITKANPGVATLGAGHGYSNYNLVYFSGLTEMTDLNTKYRVLTGNSGDTFQVGDTSTYAAAETTGGNCIQLITTPSATGVTIVSTKGGATYNWSAKDSAFNYNDASGYTYYIYKTPAVLIANGTFTSANARNSFDATTAFCWAEGLDLSPYAGTDAGSTPYLIELEDSSGDVAWGFGGAVGGGETLSETELMDDTGFNDTSKWIKAGTGNVAGGVGTCSANNDGVYQNKTKTALALYKATIGTFSRTSTPTLKIALDGGPSTIYFSTGVITSGSWYATQDSSVANTYPGFIQSGAGIITIDDVSAKQVTDCAATGLHIFTSRNGTDRGWKTIGASFGYNDEMKYRIYYIGD